VVEADEYDSAFFDKRSKFVHYRPRTAILNNLEFDHADIFADLNAIQTQFHHFVRTIPSKGLVVIPSDDENIQNVLDRGCWSELQSMGTPFKGKEGKGKGSDWELSLTEADGSVFSVSLQGKRQGSVRWGQTGVHNAANGLAAIAAARHVGVKPAVACEALCQFKGVKRRMEKLATINGISVYDDFAHHPTAIATTLQGVRNKVGSEKVIAVIEPRSNTMKLGIHKSELAESTKLADQVFWYQPDNIDWSLAEVVSGGAVPAKVVDDIDTLIKHTLKAADGLTHIVVMSNGGFSGFHGKLITALEKRHSLEEKT